MKIKAAVSNLIIGVGAFTLSYLYLPSPAFAQNTKEAQCDRIIDIANEAVTAAQSADTNEGEDQLQAIVTAAESIDEVANKMTNLSLSDGALNGYRQGLITMYRQTSLTMKRFVEAFATENQEEIFAALNDLQTATQDEDRLVTDLNNYCDRQ